MAIFVSNPASAAVQTLSSDALEPSAVAPEEGFTEELAAAMQPTAAPSDGSAKTPLDMLEDAAKKASDLQILPAEVLKNAVGDANFALTGQVGASNSAAQNAIAGSVLTHAAEDLKEVPVLDIGGRIVTCPFCMALRWRDESPSLCCREGRVQLPALAQPPPLLWRLLPRNDHLEWFN